MLDSMIRNPRPTRAEASDVANAIIDGTDAVMLSGETATGAWPVEAVQMMHRIALETERSGRHHGFGAPSVRTHGPADAIAAAMSHAACGIAAEVGAVAIIAFTMSGLTARLVARSRPSIPIIAVSPESGTVQRLSLVWGIHAIQGRLVTKLDELIDMLQIMLVGHGLFPKGVKVVLVGGHPIARGGSTNFVKVIEL
jgi:pyruvate kinase